LYNGLMMD